jgi:hypothetical protein
VTTASRSLATALSKARFASGLLRLSYTTPGDTTDKTCQGLGFLGFRWAEFDRSSETADVFIRRHIEGSWWSNWQLVRGKWTRYDEDNLGAPERPDKDLLAIPMISGVVCLAAYAPADFRTTSKTKN